MSYDVCIIGSGAGGGPVAYELSRAGFKVVVLEKGGFYKEADFDKDELSVCRREKFTPNLKDEYHIIHEKAQDGSIKRYVGHEANWSFWNGSMVGGSSNLMSGYFHRLKPDDFRLKSVYGSIKGANLCDWPISYETMEPYYDKVERLIGVSGSVKKHSFLEPRSREDFPYPKLQEHQASRWFDHACEALDFEYFPTPRAILSRSTPQRPSCVYSNFCGSYGCATGAKGSSRAALLQQCEATIIPHAFVYKLDSDKEKVTAAYYYDQARQSHKIEAKIFVLAAQAIESARLLLNSKNRFFPQGLANSSKEVGKNLIFSGGGMGEGRIYLNDLSSQDQKHLMQPGLFLNRSIQQWYAYEEKGKTYKGGTIDFLFEHQNIIPRMKRAFYDASGKLIWGEALAKKIYQEVAQSRVVSFEIFNDWLPTDDCFVSVDETHKDCYGIPVGVIHLYGHPQDLKVGEFLAQKAVKVLEKMGAKEINYAVTSSASSNLVAGGCRFGDDPKSSVLDKNCKAHDLANLYVSDASFMPTGGSVPYTWTIYANAFRVADEIIKVLKS